MTVPSMIHADWRPRSCGMAPTIGSGCSPSPPGDRRVRHIHFGNHRVGDGVPRWPGRAGHFRSNRPWRDLRPRRGFRRSSTRDNASLPPQAASLNGGHLAVPNPPPLTATHASRGRRVSNLGTRAQPRSCFLSLAEVDVGQELPASVGHDQQLGQPDLGQASLKVLRFRETAGGLLNQIITFRRRF